MSNKRDRTDYHMSWRKKNPKKYAINQLRYWQRQLNKLEKEEQEQQEAEKKYINA